jgi:uncharacterized membrane protein YphA (DoxX/SURF4 family)
MSSDQQTASPPKWMHWVGWVLTALPALMLTFSGVSKFSDSPGVVEGFKHLGWPLQMATTLAVLELGSTLLYLIPRTTVLGAILLTGYLGGAIATHVRIGETNVFVHCILGVVIWLGVYLRDARLRELIPWRR